MIPKPNGKLRHRFSAIGIPTLNDKIAQTVVKRILEPECEKFFSNQSFGFRPGRSVHHALIEVQRMMGIT